MKVNALAAVRDVHRVVAGKLGTGVGEAHLDEVQAWAWNQPLEEPSWG